jgi:AAA domain
MKTIEDRLQELGTVELFPATGAATSGLGEWDAGKDDDAIPPRGWLLGNVFCRRYLSSVVATGGTGKTALRTAQALALASGRAITDEHVFQRCRVLMVSLEDDRDELRRRFRAAMKQHHIAKEDIKGWLFLATPAALGVKLTRIENGKLEIGDLEARLREAILRLRIDVLILDPLVKAHTGEENSNGHLDFVAGILVNIAAECDCAVDVLHHVGKGAPDHGNADRGRGASAFKDAARLVYTLTTMTSEEAEVFDITDGDRRLLVRMDSAKINIAPPASSAKWFRLIGVNLGNGTDAYPHGDEVQTVEPWTPPGTWEGLSNRLCNEILTAIDKGLDDGRRYTNHNTTEELAAWTVVAEHAKEKTEKQAREVVRTWVKNGVLVVKDYMNPMSRHKAKGLWVNPAKRPT